MSWGPNNVSHTPEDLRPEQLSSLPRMNITAGQMPAQGTQGPSELQKASVPAGLGKGTA